MAELDTGSVQDLREKVAMACRILSLVGVFGEITGHVSARVPGSSTDMLLRCRGDDEFGLAYTEADAVRQCDFSGDGPGVDAAHEKPLELPIHGESLRYRTDMNAVVHAHPPGVLLCGIAGIELKPVYGAWDPSGMQMGLEGVPVYPRSVLISRPELAHAMLNVMGTKQAVIMKGHGVTVVGKTVEDAVLRTIQLERLARVMWALSQRGQVPDSISFQDVEEFSRRGGKTVSKASEWTWRYYVKLIEEGRKNLDLLPVF